MLFELFDRALQEFDDPARVHNPIIPSSDQSRFEWKHRSEDGSLTEFSVYLGGSDLKEQMEFGQMIHTLYGIHNIVISYPHLNTYCDIYDEYETGMEEIGFLVVAYMAPH